MNSLPGAVTGTVRTTLRFEGLAVFAASILLYQHLDCGWGAFALFLLAPDLSMLGYLAGARAGAVAYNAAHSYIGPLAALAIGILLSLPSLVCAGTIWCAHIGLDRALGYGLKYSEGFGSTHLGQIGRAQTSSPKS